MNGSGRASRPGASALWIFALVLVILAAGAGGAFLWKEWRWEKRAQNERAAAAATRALANALMYDPDGQMPRSVSRYMGDVRGLGALGLIEPALAAADPAYPDAQPYHGYWLILLESVDPAIPPGVKVGTCAYPARYGWDAYPTFIWCLEHSQLKADTRGLPPRRVPPLAELQRNWAKYD